MRDPVSGRAPERRGRHHGSDQPLHAATTQKAEAAAQSAGVNFECRSRCGVAHRRPLHVRTGRGRHDRRARCFPPCSHPRRRASLSPLNWCRVRPGVAMMSRRAFHLVAQLVQSVGPTDPMESNMQNRGKSARPMASDDIADMWRRVAAIVAGNLLGTGAVPGSRGAGTP